MRHEVTRDVVNDLWPLYASAEASADSRALVDAYLAHDGEFAALLKAAGNGRRAVPPVRLSPDAEVRLLLDAQRTARIRLLVIGGGVTLAGLMLLASLLWVAMLFFRTGR